MLISAIMPTRGRQLLAAAAVQCWLNQTYRPTELVIIDDMDAPSFPGGLSLPGVQYHMLRRRLTIGEKRNLACSRAVGEVIAHFDDDDVSAPGRLADQFEQLQATGKPLTGYRTMALTDGANWWRYTGPNDYALGTSLMYLRSWWAANAFLGEQVGEDNAFITPARATGQISVTDAGEFMYARIHAGNTSVKEPGKNPTQWKRIECPATWRSQ